MWFTNSVLVSPISGANIASNIAVGFVFQYVVRKRNFRWWAKFNYVTGAGLDAGTGFGAILVFFAFLVSERDSVDDLWRSLTRFKLPKNGKMFVDWWGNRVWTESE